MDYEKEIIILRTNLEELEKKLFLVKRNASNQVDVDLLKADIRACQTSLNSIGQDLLTIGNTLQTQSTSIEELQTFSTSVSETFSSLDSQISQINTKINIINGNIEYLSTTLTQTTFDLELLKPVVDSLRTNFFTFQTEMATAKSNIQANATAITSLQASLAPVAFSGNYNDLTNKPSGDGGSGEERDEMDDEGIVSSSDEFYELNEFEKVDAKGETQREKIYFVCCPEMYIEGNVDVHLYSFYYTYTGTVRMYYGEELVFEKTVTLNNYEQMFNFPFRIYPKDKKGYFTISIVYDNNIFIKNSTFHITSAKNFLFLKNNLRWTVTVYKNKYYIGQNKKFPNPYYILDANNFQFNNPNIVYSALPIWATFFPKPTYANGALTIDENYVYAISRDQWSFKYDIYDMTASMIWSSKHEAYGFSFTYFTDHSSIYQSYTITSVYGSLGQLAYWSGHPHTSFGANFIPYKVNGVEVEAGCWICNVAVQQLDMTNAPFDAFQGSVAVRNDGMCIFYPHYNTTYFIELGIGRRPTAFRQENGNVHIYIGRNNHVIKFVLVKNQTTNQFEIFSREKIYGVQQYHETLDNKAIYLIGDQIKLVNL